MADGRQYQAIKARYPDVLVLFRLGDFYEMFGEDAKIGAQVLQLVLTSREIGRGNRVPMCGVPHHAVERYIAKLLEAGYKVAICDQLEEPSPKKRLVHRDVTRVLTPGTLVEEAFLEAKQYNFLVAISGARDTEQGTRAVSYTHLRARNTGFGNNDKKVRDSGRGSFNGRVCGDGVE